MRYLVWALRLVIFVAVLMFALKNTNPVQVTFYNDYVLQNVPLIVVMLAVFFLGAIFGLLLTVPAALRRRREVVRLRREVDRMQALLDGPDHDGYMPPPEVVAPMSPF
jgi:putative membrane protein